MYNEDVKMAFCEEKEIKKTSSGIGWAFNKISANEEKIGLDIAEMKQEDCINTIKQMGIAEASSINTILSSLKLYVKWCIERRVFENIPGGIFEVSPKDIDLSESLGKILFKDESDLVASIQTIRSLDEGLTEVAVFCLNWVGLDNHQVIALRDTDVDLKNRIIYGSNGEILATGFMITDLICDVLERYCECKYSTKVQGTGLVMTTKDRSTTAFLKKMIANTSMECGKEYTLSSITSLCNRAARDYEDLGYSRRHTYQNIWRSGRYNYMYRIEQSGVDVLDKSNRSVVEGIFRGRKSNYYNAIKMYQYYKKVFNL